MNDRDLRVVLEGRPVVLFVVGVLLTDKQEIFSTALAPGPMRNAATETVRSLEKELRLYHKHITTLAPETGTIEITRIVFFSRIGDDGSVEVSAYLSGIRGMDTNEIQISLTRVVFMGFETARVAMSLREVLG